MRDVEKLKDDLNKLRNVEKARIFASFFKTEKGQYGEGDIFLGISVPTQRKIASKYYSLALNDLQSLISSKIHEQRFVSLIILINKYNKADRKTKKEIIDFYLNNIKYINNWDLVDLSAPSIIGDYLLITNRKILYQMAESKNIWKKRIAIISTYTFIKTNAFEDTLKIAKLLLNDKEDLIHKAVGWMLREVGKRDLKTEEKFLFKYCRKMPRTMLRYAIEKFPPEKRGLYLNK